MRLPRRGVLIRLFIYVPLIGFLGWRAYSARCGEPAPTIQPEPDATDELAPYRKTIVLPDGTQQEIVEMTRDQAEAVLGHPLPDEIADKDAAAAKGSGDVAASGADAADAADGGTAGTAASPAAGDTTASPAAGDETAAAAPAAGGDAAADAD